MPIPPRLVHGRARHVASGEEPRGRDAWIGSGEAHADGDDSTREADPRADLGEGEYRVERGLPVRDSPIDEREDEPVDHVGARLVARGERGVQVGASLVRAGEWWPVTGAGELDRHGREALRRGDKIDPADISASAPKKWSQLESPTLLGILGRHAYDEAWIPDVIAGRAAADGDPYADADLLGDDPIASYDALNDAAAAAVRSGGFAETFRFTYGDYPAAEGFAHMATYRAFQAYSIAKHFGIPFHLSPELIDGLNEHVVPHADEWRQWGVFPPAIEPPADADEETRLLCAVGFWGP